MLTKYNLAIELSDLNSTNIKWVVPKSFELTQDHLYQFNSVAITKGTPFDLNTNIDPIYTLRYLMIQSDNSFTLKLNNSFEFLTNSFALDVGPDRTGFTNLSKITNVLITNPTGQSGIIGNQFTNPNVIEVRYIVIIEKLL